MKANDRALDKGHLHVLLNPYLTSKPYVVGTQNNRLEYPQHFRLRLSNKRNIVGKRSVHCLLSNPLETDESK